MLMLGVLLFSVLCFRHEAIFTLNQAKISTQRTNFLVGRHNIDLS